MKDKEETPELNHQLNAEPQVEGQSSLTDLVVSSSIPESNLVKENLKDINNHEHIPKNWD